MKAIFWGLLARVLALPPVADWLIRQAKKTPYFHIGTPDGAEIYMERYWLLNPYDRKTQTPKWRWFPWSIRVHHIRREDQDKHCHDHPWNARTFILKGWYQEDRLVEGSRWPINYIRKAGRSAAINFGQYHKITEVSPGGVVTLFVSGPYQGLWGFMVDGTKVYWKTYLGIPFDEDLKPLDVE